MGQVRRAIKHHIKTYGSYDISCWSWNDAKARTKRSFMALDDNAREFYGVDICGIRFRSTVYDLIILLSGQLLRSLPATIQAGYWVLRIDGDEGDGKLSYTSECNFRGWEHFYCASMDLHLSVDDLEAAKSAIDSYIMQQVMTEAGPK